MLCMKNILKASKFNKYSYYIHDTFKTSGRSQSQQQNKTFRNNLEIQSSIKKFKLNILIIYNINEEMIQTQKYVFFR